jgi:uncharacterized RDD family membrane protein YckC
MKWYYVDDGQQAGPVEETEFPQLSRLGKLRADTLMWREGMANWEPFSAVCPTEYTTIATATRAAVPPAGNEAVCGECGGIFDKNDMIPHGNVYICAGCKPVFMQKLAEGAKLNTGELNYAGIGTRFGAVVLDGILLWIVSFVTQMLSMLVVTSAMRSQPQLFLVVQFALIFVQLVIGLSYETVMIGKYGATLGKMACKIKVVTASGGRVSYARALGRYFAKLLSGCPTLLIGFLMAVFDKEEHRALHDRICDTRVIMK